MSGIGPLAPASGGTHGISPAPRLRGGGALSSSDTFNTEALELFAYQYEHNAPYRAFCDGRGVTPNTVTRWQDIPPAPMAAFKRFTLSCVPEEESVRVFHSSGTTGAETSRHYMSHESLEMYRQSLHASYRHFIHDGGYDRPIYALMPSPQENLHSSLSFMLGELISDYWTNSFGGDGWQINLFQVLFQNSFYADNNWQARLLPELENLTEPIVLFGTAFAFVYLLDEMEQRGMHLTLPKRTLLIETGGFKGRTREVSRDELYGLFTERLGVPAMNCLSEYGMSEMASQFYDISPSEDLTQPRRKASLPYLLRTRVLDPVTGEEAAPGQPGVLVHYDLANLNSVLAIQTEDWGYACEDGEGFVLLGRAPGAALRGCSLTAEEFAARQA